MKSASSHKNNQGTPTFVFVILLALTNLALAETPESEAQAAQAQATESQSTQQRAQDCLLQALAISPDSASVGNIKAGCGIRSDDNRQISESAIRGRLALEEVTRFNPFVITPHNRNYVLPLTYWSNPNWYNPAKANDPIDHLEAKFQLSVKLPLATNLWMDSTLYGAMTLEAFWQAYNEPLSSPFRETNYRPEFFMATPASGRFGNLKLEMIAWGIEHQSNGQALPLSRSWNRLFTKFIFQYKDNYFAFRPWWRIPESEKNGPNDPSGDDNPDIEHFYGHFELNAARLFGNHVAELMIRNNLRSENRGAARLDYSFPLSKRFKGLFQFFSGYGDSLISYNEYQNRVGIGILLTDSL